MKKKLVHELAPGHLNPRNSEGSFIRADNGDILFAYSRYNGTSSNDHASCDIALIRSSDEGETWSEPVIIARASDFGTANIMSVSANRRLNGELAFYFLIKHDDGLEITSTIGRVRSANGIDFTVEHCHCLFPEAYYVINNDRMVRLSDGRLVCPASYNADVLRNEHMAVTLLVSEDDGDSFYRTKLSLEDGGTPILARSGYQEPGIIEYSDRLYLWMRTLGGCQYESISTTGLDGFFQPRPSCFTSPLSPMQVVTIDDITYAVYNPIPNYNGRILTKSGWGRTPFVLQKSTDEGYTFGPLNVIEDDPERGYCYPAIFKTTDGALLIAYCRGNEEDGKCLNRLGIAKIEISTIE